MTTAPQKTIGTLLQEQADRYGDRPFVDLPGTGRTLSYVEVGGLVASVATQLACNGLVGGGRTVVILPNGPEAIVAMLAVMAAGGVAVPVNPGLAVAEIARIIELAKAQIVLTDTQHGNKVGQTGGTPLVARHLNSNALPLDLALFRPASVESATDAGVSRHGTDAADPALILFTSGTTGHPKGVVLTHGNLLATAGSVTAAHRLTRDDTALCVLPLYHINGLVVTLLAPLLSGGRVVMPQRFSAEKFWQWVADYRATWFSAVPTILSILLSHGDPPGNALPMLRFARSASAPLPVAVLEEFERRFGIPIIETYGISETGSQVTANPLPPLARKPGSAGIPVGNELSVVDTDGESRSAGAIGEVVIRGPNVFGGYLDNPAADREALRDGWFHTGDLGYLDGDGYLFLTGRKRELINRAGEKITPREVEEIIHRLPEVEAAGVVGVPHPLYGEEVVAFITVRLNQTLEAEKVRQFCREHLARFKVPCEVFFLDELPKGPSGKIQRKRLVHVYHEIKSQQREEKQA